MSSPGDRAEDARGSGMPHAARVLDLLTAVDATLAVAESLTGGLVAAELTAIAGASRSFPGSVTAYATACKAAVLGVDAELLREHGAVHPAVAEQMAEGVRQLMESDYGLATTGVAGPTPQDGQPVGTVFLACAGPRGITTRAPVLTGDRSAIRRGAVDTVLQLACAQLAFAVQSYSPE